MNKLEISVGKELFRFHSFSNWVNKARGWFEAAGFRSHQYVCIDAAGRICTSGQEFNRAKKENKYPIVVYLIDDEQEDRK